MNKGGRGVPRPHKGLLSGGVHNYVFIITVISQPINKADMTYNSHTLLIKFRLLL